MRGTTGRRGSRASMGGRLAAALVLEIVGILVFRKIIKINI